MRSIYVADVGDGLCMTVNTISGKVVQIDCGGQRGEAAFKGLNKVINRFLSIDAFVLSHFHIDHYNGLLYASRTQEFDFTIKEVYYPRIPEFKEKEEFLQCLFAMNARVFGSETGVAEYDLLEAIWRINKGISPQHRSLSKGDNVCIDGSVFEVLWPPRVVEHKKILSPIRRAIEDFKRALDEDEETKRLYDYVKEEGTFRAYLREQSENSEHKQTRIHNDSYVALNWKKRRLPEVVRRANDSLLEASNHLSLVLFEDNRLLFMGDAESFEIRQVVNDLKTKGRTSFFILITPHHGSHWHNSFWQIRCLNSITSNGSKLCSKMKQQFKDISCRSLATFVNGDIAMSMFPTARFCELCHGGSMKRVHTFENMHASNGDMRKKESYDT